MKSESVIALCALFWTLAAAAVVTEERFGAAQTAIAPAPAPATASGPGAAIEVLEVKFEILNYNYYDLEEEVLVQLEVQDPFDVSKKTTLFGERVAGAVRSVFEDRCKEVGSAPGPAAAPAAAPEAPSGLLNLAAAPAPGFAASPSAGSADPIAIFVNIKPGDLYKPKDKVSFLHLGSTGRTTVVQVQITDNPMTGMQLVTQAKVIVEKAIADGTLKRDLVIQLTKAASIKPRIIFAGEKSQIRMVPEWNKVTCESHLQKVVRMFEVAYTRRMVPMAFYNECTNFIPALSFSHDKIHSPIDKTKCRKASLKFAKRWNFNKASWKYGTTKKHEQMDYSAFCHEICEIRYGDGAPKCNVP